MRRRGFAGKMSRLASRGRGRGRVRAARRPRHSDARALRGRRPRSRVLEARSAAGVGRARNESARTAPAAGSFGVGCRRRRCRRQRGCSLRGPRFAAVRSRRCRSRATAGRWRRGAHDRALCSTAQLCDSKGWPRHGKAAVGRRDEPMTGQAEIGLIGLGVMGAEPGPQHRRPRLSRSRSTTGPRRAPRRSPRATRRRRCPIVPCATPRGAGRRAPAAAGDHADGQGGRGDRRADRRAGAAARAGRHDHRRRQRPLPGHHPARAGAARARAAVPRHGRLGRRGGRAPGPLDHARRRRRGLCPRQADLPGDRRQGRRRAVLRLCRRRTAPATSSR